MTRKAAWAINLSGAIVALIISVAIYGQRAEEYFLPVMQNLSIQDVAMEGRRVYWTLQTCKVRGLHLDSTGFTFRYAKGTGPGVQVQITNEATKLPAGQSPLPKRCVAVRYSSLVPMDAAQGDILEGVGWYDSFHPFWLVSQDFGKIILPAPATGRGE